MTPSLSDVQSRRSPRPGAAALALAIAGGAVVLGWALATNQAFGLEPGPLALALLAIAATVAVIFAGPIPCIAAIAVLAGSGLDRELAEVGPVNATTIDILWVGLAGWWLVQAAQAALERTEPRSRVAFGQVPAIAFVVWAGLSLIVFEIPENEAWISWLRVVNTFLLAWLAASLIHTRRDVEIIMAALVAGAVLGIVVAAFSGGSLFSTRIGGELGKNVLGLMSGFLLLAALFLDWDRRLRFTLGAVAVLGLVLAKSVASFIAGGVGVALGAAFIATPERSVGIPRAARAGVGLIVMAVIVIGAVSVLRPEQLPGSEDFKQGSATQRILVGYAGLQVFADNPIAGVGWRQSSEPEVIGDRDIAIAVRRRFPDAREVLYPDVTPTTVHNTYVQVLAELGIIGFLLLAALIVAVGYRVVDLLRRLGPAHPLYRPAFVMALVLVSSLIFHNEVPLFGGQAETIIPVMVVGVLAAISRMDLDDRLTGGSRDERGRRIRFR